MGRTPHVLLPDRYARLAPLRLRSARYFEEIDDVRFTEVQLQPEEPRLWKGGRLFNMKRSTSNFQGAGEGHPPSAGPWPDKLSMATGLPLSVLNP
jgi:hypothetical protein